MEFQEIANLRTAEVLPCFGTRRISSSFAYTLALLGAYKPIGCFPMAETEELLVHLRF